MLEVCKWQSTWGYQVEEDDWEKNLHIIPKRHKDGKFQWQYKEYEEQNIYGNGCTTIIIHAQEREIQTKCGIEKAVRIARELDSWSYKRKLESFACQIEKLQED